MFDKNIGESFIILHENQDTVEITGLMNYLENGTTKKFNMRPNISLWYYKGFSPSEMSILTKCEKNKHK